MRRFRPRGVADDCCCSSTADKIKWIMERIGSMVTSVKVNGTDYHPDGGGKVQINLKSVGGQSLLGTGDIPVIDGTEWGDITGTLADQTDLKDALDDKLDEPETTGTAGQVLKLNADLEPVWANESGGGGTVEWGDIGGTLADQTDLANALADKADSSSLATVATTGDYDDLIDKPSLATVATTGDYDDLTDKPDLSNYIINKKYLNSSAEQVGNVSIDGRATREYSIRIGSGADMAGYHAIGIGTNVNCPHQFGIVIGDGSSIRGSSGNNAIALGHYAFTEAEAAVQIGNGVNTTANSLQFLAYPIIRNGKIYASTIAPTSGANAGQVLTLDSNLDTVWATPPGGSTKTSITTLAELKSFLADSETGSMIAFTTLSNPGALYENDDGFMVCVDGTSGKWMMVSKYGYDTTPTIQTRIVTASALDGSISGMTPNTFTNVVGMT